MMVLSNDPIAQRGTSMHHRIDTIIRRIRQDVATQIDADSIETACREVGHSWRNRRLNPVAIIHWFLVQVLHGNTSIEHVALLGGGLFTGEAYCLARTALPLLVFQKVLANLLKSLIPITESEGRWLNHRTWLIDGSSFSMPDTPELQNQFGQPGGQKPGCGFPVAKILTMFHAGTGLLMEIIPTPLRSHEMAGVRNVLRSMKPNDVLVGDRGFCSFAHLAILRNGGIHAVFRIHQKQIVDFRPNRPHARVEDRNAQKGLPRSRWLRSLGVLDQVVEWFKPKYPPKWMTAEEYAALPATLILRELRYQVGRPGFRTKSVTLVTTLTDGEIYTLEALADLYGSRWRVELNLRHLKTTMKLDVLKCKTVEGILKELTVYAIVYNLVRIVMLEASRRQGVDVERISFIAAMRWLAEAEPGEELTKLVVNPARPGRFEPRVVKRRPKQYKLMNKPRRELRKDLLKQGVAA